MSFPSGRPVRCLITTGDCTSSNFQTQAKFVLETIRLAVEAGLEMVQIREKLLPTRLLFDLATGASGIIRGSRTKLLINERFDVALASDADGVHLTSTSIPVAQVRASVPQGFIVGVSTHSEPEVAAAKDAGADFAFFGPVFTTPSKDDSKGLWELELACRSVSPFPVLAIGGIDGSNQAQVLSIGAAGFAAIRDLNDFVRIEK